MLFYNDFDKKQIVFAFFNKGEKLSFRNDNVIVKTADGKIKTQLTCYRLILLVIVGHTVISSGLIQRCKKFGFTIALMTPGFRLYHMIGEKREGNTVLRNHQYHYHSLSLAKHLTENKLRNQRAVLMAERDKTLLQKQAIANIGEYIENLWGCETLEQLLGYEGIAAKVYFDNFFINMPAEWRCRRPRVKCDAINAVLDLGYTVLFTFIETLLSLYGFDLYQGVMHRAFYMRKSLVCDLVEPFRGLIDVQTRKSFRLRQFTEQDFKIFEGRYTLSWEKSPAYVEVFLKALLDRKEEIFFYIQSYYRCFMKQKPAEEFPVFHWEKNHDRY